MTRNEVVNKARELIGLNYAHQGRDLNGIDCVGVLTYIAQSFNYPYTDLEGYKRTPSAGDLIALLRENLDEIELSEATLADIYLMRLGQGIKPRHTAIISNITTDYEKGIEPMIIHSLNTLSVQKVVEQPISIYRGQIVKAFRLRGILD